MTSVSVRQTVRANRLDETTGVHFVPLLRVPDDLQFPEPLHDRIWFDDQRKCLAFRGFMSKATYDRLDNLTNDDAYQRALDELFRQSVYDEPATRQRPLPKVLPFAILVTVALLALTLALPLKFLAER